MYKFYGADDANIMDKNGLTPKDYYDLLSSLWSFDTCAPRMRDSWSINNKTKGQCSITAFLMQDIYGGDVYGIPLGDGNYHCFNKVDRFIFDLTSEQFHEPLDYSNAVLQSRDIHFMKEEKKNRYLLLKKRLEDKLFLK